MKDYINMNTVLNNIEVIAYNSLVDKLEPFIKVTDWLFSEAPKIVEVTVEKNVTTLKNVQHMFLKQSLNSLRAIVILVLRGYTSQAATIASSLYEIRLYSNYILDHQDRAEYFMKHSNSQDFVWRPKKMIRSEAQFNVNQMANKATLNVDDEIKSINSTYMFLCSLKHNNPIPLRHTVGAKDDFIGASITDGFPVMALPDTRDSDLPTKATVLIAAINSTFYVLRNVSLTVINDSGEFNEWIQKLFKEWNNAVDVTKENLPKYGPMPFPTIPK
ncbi:DUF5677 domain-containing protein [Paenibacillus xylanexedens]|uniref:DUF5677 domain-containing protein n=1 Tax=Paenibacillus xylanexedens TaxID=528191 RepID=UPI003D010E76